MLRPILACKALNHDEHEGAFTIIVIATSPVSRLARAPGAWRHTDYRTMCRCGFLRHPMNTNAGSASISFAHH